MYLSETMNIRNTLSSWSKEDCVKFAVWCARRVAHLNDHPRMVADIEAAERWLQDPSEANRSAAYAAADAAYAAASDAARAASDAAYAAGAAGAARAAAYAASDAAYGAADGNLTDYDLLQIYLSDTLMNAVEDL